MNFEELNLTPEQQEKVTALLQSEGDKIRTKYSKELSELKEQLPELEKKQQELKEKEKEIANKEKTYTLKEKLASNGLPTELAKYLAVGDDVDELVKEIGGTLNSHFLNESHKPTNHNKNEGLTKDQFHKMPYMERAKLFETNPELYKKLAE